MSRLPITKRRPWTPASGAFAGRTFHTEREYRDALARSKGFGSWAEQQRASGPEVHSRRGLRGLRPSEREAYEKAGTVLTLMRADPQLPFTKAVRRAHTTPAAVHRHAGGDLAREGGRYRPNPTDTHFRRLWLPTETGPVAYDTRDSRAASEIARYNAAVAWFLDTGDDARLAPFRGRRIPGTRRTYLTDLAVLEELARRGELSFESIYATAA